MADYIGDLSDSELIVFAENFATALNAAPSDYAATAAQASDVGQKKNALLVSLDTHETAQAAARSATQTKNSDRDALEAALRFIINQAKLNKVGGDKVARLGAPMETVSDAPSNATRPIGICDTSQRFQHTLDFRDESQLDSKRIPRGVLGAEIYRKIGGEPPASLKECNFLVLDTRTPYVIEYDGEDAGKIVHYIFRWRFRDESTSPISETVSATVAG